MTIQNDPFNGKANGHFTGHYQSEAFLYCMKAIPKYAKEHGEAFTIKDLEKLLFSIDKTVINEVARQLCIEKKLMRSRLPGYGGTFFYAHELTQEKAEKRAKMLQKEWDEQPDRVRGKTVKTLKFLKKANPLPKVRRRPPKANSISTRWRCAFPNRLPSAGSVWPTSTSARWSRKWSFVSCGVSIRTR